MAEYLGIDADSDSGLMDVARMAVAAPTPPGWQQLDNADGSTLFRSLPLLCLLAFLCTCLQRYAYGHCVRSCMQTTDSKPLNLAVRLWTELHFVSVLDCVMTISKLLVTVARAGTCRVAKSKRLTLWMSTSQSSSGTCLNACHLQVSVS